MTDSSAIFHWCGRDEWEAAGDEYAAPSLTDEGFIHCSALHQVARTASVVDRRRADLVLLSVDPAGLPVIWEDCYELGEEYPHVYGPIPRSAVTGVLPFPCRADGSFVLPAPLSAGG